MEMIRLCRSWLVWAVVLLTACFQFSVANNIRIIGKPDLVSNDTAKKTVLIKFDLAWDNSWRLSKPNNYDAAWVFVKCWDGESWNHVYPDSTDYSYGNKKGGGVNKGVSYYVSDREGKDTLQDMVMTPGYSQAYLLWKTDPAEKSGKYVAGFFIHRKTIGAGDVVLPGVTMKWNYGRQGFVPEDDLVVKVFAVEMVYIPQGPYYLGGIGDQVNYSFTTNGATMGSPMYVESEAKITVANNTLPTTLWAVSNTIETGEIPAAFPKGFQAFYIMKYELSQEAYVEFLNTLSQGQQDGRINPVLDQLTVGSYIYPNGNYWRLGIKVKQAVPTVEFACDVNGNGTYNETDTYCYGPKSGSTCLGKTITRNLDGQDLAMTLVSMYDLLAYAEFAALRPMTELEYEKACRGPVAPKQNEYAWGSMTKVFFYDSYTKLPDYNTGTERRPIGTSYNMGIGKATNVCPLRVGIFADSVSGRVESGATYWGVMNMSDNPAEMCVSVYNATGRAFQGVHGSGRLDVNGEATTEGWKISADQYYYIARGMYVTGTSATNYASGMISSRYDRTPGAGTTRSTILRAIRCVRTEGAQN